MELAVIAPDQDRDPQLPLPGLLRAGRNPSPEVRLDLLALAADRR